jgi:hypothetical protein
VWSGIRSTSAAFGCFPSCDDVLPDHPKPLPQPVGLEPTDTNGNSSGALAIFCALSSQIRTLWRRWTLRQHGATPKFKQFPPAAPEPDRPLRPAGSPKEKTLQITLWSRLLARAAARRWTPTKRLACNFVKTTQKSVGLWLVSFIAGCHTDDSKCITVSCCVNPPKKNPHGLGGGVPRESTWATDFAGCHLNP